MKIHPAPSPRFLTHIARLRSGLTALAMVAGALTLNACASSPQGTEAMSTPPPAPQAVPSTAVSGTASFRERIALPPDAVFEATLLDISRADASATVLGRERIAPVRGPVIDFRIPYNPAAIQPNMTYSVRATIMTGGRLLFTTDTVAPVLTRGAGNTVSLPLRMVVGDGQVLQPVATAPATLINTYWRVLSIDGQAVAPVRGNQREPHLVLTDDGRAEPRARVYAGCNQIGGGYSVRGTELAFSSNMISTRMACMPPLDAQEARMQRVLALKPLRWRVEGQQLTLSDGAGRVVVEARAENMK